MLLIRRAAPADAPAITEVHIASIRQLCAPSYSEAEIEAWASSKRPARYLKPIAQHHFFVAEQDLTLGSEQRMGSACQRWARELRCVDDESSQRL